MHKNALDELPEPVLQPTCEPAPGVAFEVTEGNCTYWFDGPLAMWVHGPAGDLHAEAIPKSSKLNAQYVALHMGELEIHAYRDLGVDMYTLMTVADARLYAVRVLQDGSLQAWRLADPLDDDDLPGHGMIYKDFDLWVEDQK